MKHALRQSAQLFGRRCLGWMFVCFLAGITLVVVEFSVAIFLQLFVVSIGLVKPATLPSWMPASLYALSLHWILLMLIAIGVFRSASYFLADIGAGMVLEQSQARLRLLTIYELLFAKDPKRAVGAAEINLRLGELIPHVGFFGYYVTLCLAYGVIGAFLIVGMALLAPKEALVGVFGLGGIGALILWLNRKAREKAGYLPEHYKRLQGGIERVARNLLFVRISRTEPREAHAFQEDIGEYYSHSMQAIFYSAIASNAAPFLGILLLVAIVFLSQRSFFTPGVQLLAFLYLFLRFIQQLKLLSQFWGEINRRWARFHQSLAFFLRIPPDERALALAPYEAMGIQHVPRPPPAPAAAVDLDEAQAPPRLQIRDLRFQYPGSEKLLFDGFQLQIEAGEALGIIGESGVGKSTLMALLLGLFPPDEGEILIGDHSPQQIFSSGDLRVGYVGAEPFLIAGTLAENLSYGCPAQVDQEAMWEALEQAQLASTVRGLEGGLSYPLNAQGEGMSAGEKQRLALARALLRKPSLLFLDEASANLDVDTEARIAETLKQLRGSCTLLIISHRKGLLKYVDRWIELGPSASQKGITSPASR